MHSKKIEGLRARFTLIELVVVLAILVILAGGLLVKLDVLQLRANKGVAASDMASTSRMVQTYVVANNHYPDLYDSLIDPTGPNLWGDGFAGAPTAYVGLDPQTVAGPGSTHHKLALFALPATGTALGGGSVDDVVNSLGRMGITSVVDLANPADPGFPSDAFGGTPRAIVPGGAIAVLNASQQPAFVGLTAGTTDGDADAIMASFYPQTNGVPPTDCFVAVFGLGRFSTIVGRSGLIQNPPLYANSGDRTRFYARELLCYEVSATGSRTRFLGALGADGDRLEEEITEFYEIQ